MPAAVALRLVEVQVVIPIARVDRPPRLEPSRVSARDWTYCHSNILIDITMDQWTELVAILSKFHCPSPGSSRTPLTLVTNDLNGAHNSGVLCN